jgi:sulfur-oxidizing protein SoxA
MLKARIFDGLILLLLLLAVCACSPPRGNSTQAPVAQDIRRSGYSFMSPATQAMQDNDAINPGMLWVVDGRALWNKPEGPSQLSCASCHQDAANTMQNVAARYPAFDVARGRPLDLGQKIQQCRQERQRAPAWRNESQELLSMETYLAYQSRGTLVSVGTDSRLQAQVRRGDVLYHQRMGQLNLSCAQCHDERWGQHLGSSIIPQAYANAYPVYRLEWQGMGSLQRRLRNCMSGVRAQPYAFDSEEMVDLELYLAARSRGMHWEAPGVRP